MARRCARLAVFAFAAARGTEVQERGDVVALVQHTLQSQNAQEELTATGVTAAIGSLINILKLENLVRKSSINEDAAAPPAPIDLAREIPDDEVPPFRIPADVQAVRPTLPPPIKEVKAKRSLYDESGLLVGRMDSDFYDVDKTKVFSQEAVTRAGQGCSTRDNEHMQKAIADVHNVVEQYGMDQIRHLLPYVCKDAFFLYVNYTRLTWCVQHFFEVSPKCAKCHSDMFKAVGGTSPFHLNCNPTCYPLLSHCPGGKNQPPSEKCFAAFGKCLDCTWPSLKAHAPCLGGVLNHEETLNAVHDLAHGLSRGKIKNPWDFRSALDETYDKIAKVK